MLLNNAILLVLLIASALTDCLQGKIYNKVTYPSIIVGIVSNTFLEGSAGLQASLVGLGIGFVPFFFLFLMGLMNGGDVKLLAAIGALKAYPFILYAIFLTFLVAAFMALAKMIWKGQFIRTMKLLSRTIVRLVVPGMVVERRQGEETIPFGLAALVGTLWAVAVVDFQVSLGS